MIKDDIRQKWANIPIPRLFIRNLPIMAMSVGHTSSAHHAIYAQLTCARLSLIFENASCGSTQYLSHWTTITQTKSTYIDHAYLIPTSALNFYPLQIWNKIIFVDSRPRVCRLKNYLVVLPRESRRTWTRYLETVIDYSTIHNMAQRSAVVRIFKHDAGTRILIATSV